MEKVTSPFFIEAKEVSLGHDARKPISAQPLTFQLEKGAVTALIGPNGSGKSTLINAFIGSSSIIRGDLLCYGQNVRTISKKQLAEFISILPQENNFPGELMVKHFLELAFLPRSGLFKPLPSIKSPDFYPLVKHLSLETLFYKVLKNLSSGERQRIFLARALLQNPKLLLLDEPTNHLDPKATFDFWETTLYYRKNQKVDVLISSHNLEMVKNHCDWILALKNGSLFFSGPKDLFFNQNLVNALYS